MIKRNLVLFALFCGLTLPAISVAAPPLEGGMAQFNLFDTASPAPDTPLTDSAENIKKLGDFKGKVVLVNFWATWCAPCLREMPSLDRLAGLLKTEKFAVLAINENRGGVKMAAPFFEKLGIKHLVSLFDNKMALARAMKIRGMPTTFLLDGDGNTVGELTGVVEWDSPESIALIRYYLDRL